MKIKSGLIAALVLASSSALAENYSHFAGVDITEPAVYKKIDGSTFIVEVHAMDKEGNPIKGINRVDLVTRFTTDDGVECMYVTGAALSGGGMSCDWSGKGQTR